jgi:acylglycerol lipase
MGTIGGGNFPLDSPLPKEYFLVIRFETERRTSLSSEIYNPSRRDFLKGVMIGVGGYAFGSMLIHPRAAMGQSKESAMSETSFSFRELSEAGKVTLATPQSLQATDGIRLSYRRYTPAAPRAAVLFYHGGGAHSGASYQYIGNSLQTRFDTVVYTPDIRGHGISEGPRGDAPNPKQVWEDVTSCIKQIRADYPHLPIFLGGHSSGAGLALNYASQAGHEPVIGYIFLSPQFGFRSQTDRPAQSAPFAKVDASAFADYAVSGGTAHGHDYAVKFNYPAELLKADPGMVPAITVNMSIALTPFSPHEQFAALNCPFGLWIGSEDELFVPEKVLAFADLAVSVRADSQVSTIPGAKHLSVLLRAHETIGPWITRMVQEKKAIMK